MMVYKKEHKCERCGNITIARTSQKRFCGDCKIVNYKEWKKEWLKNPINKEKCRERLRISRIKYPETKRKIQKRYAKNHPEKIIAQQMAKKILLKQSCRICKYPERLERHHWRYDRPLLVSTLCKDCHTIQHTKHFTGGI